MSLQDMAYRAILRDVIQKSQNEGMDTAYWTNSLARSWRRRDILNIHRIYANFNYIYRGRYARRTQRMFGGLNRMGGRGRGRN